MKIKVAIFDIDGTVLNSMKIWDTLPSDYLKSKGKSPEADLNSVIEEMTLTTAAQYLRFTYRLEQTDCEVEQELYNRLAEFYRFDVELKEGVSDYIKGLCESGCLILAATSTQKSLAEAALKRLGLYEYFDEILTCDDLFTSKSEPYIYERALAMSGAEKCEALVFEDSLFAASTAVNAGFRVIGVYDESQAEDEAEMRRICEKYIYSFNEMGNGFD